MREDMLAGEVWTYDNDFQLPEMSWQKFWENQFLIVVRQDCILNSCARIKCEIDLGIIRIKVETDAVPYERFNLEVTYLH